MKFIALLVISFTALAQMGTCPLSPNGINDLVEEQPAGSSNWVPLCDVSVKEQRDKILETSIVPGEEVKAASINLKYNAVNEAIKSLIGNSSSISYTSLTIDQIQGEIGLLQTDNSIVFMYDVFQQTQPGPHSGGYNIPTAVYEPILNNPVAVSYNPNGNTSVEVYEISGLYYQGNDCFLLGKFRVNGSGEYGTGQPLQFPDATRLTREQCLDVSKWFYNTNEVTEGSFVDSGSGNIYYTYYPTE